MALKVLVSLSAALRMHGTMRSEHRLMPIERCGHRIPDSVSGMIRLLTPLKGADERALTVYILQTAHGHTTGIVLFAFALIIRGFVARLCVPSLLSGTQGMAFVAGVILMYLPEEPAFRVLCQLLDDSGGQLLLNSV